MWLSTWSDWLIFFLIVQVIHFAGTWQLYIKAGRKAWEAAIPVYNAIVMLDIMKRPKWWVILLFLPIISPIMIMVMWVDFIRSYGKRGIGDAILVIVTLGFYIYYLNYVEKPDYTGPEERKETLISALLFAVVLATIVHTYFVQPMIIPTGSMENTMKIGDALFVSKNVYGTRLPNTPVSVPFSDLFSRNLFVEKLQLPYTRIPGWDKVKKNDIVVFNFPTDSIYKPIDRKDNYVKRCVGEPGDVIEMREGVLFVNNEKFEPKKDALLQHSASVQYSTQLSPKFLVETYGLVETDYRVSAFEGGYQYDFFGVTDDMFNQLKALPNAIQSTWIVQPADAPSPNIFPKGEKWNVDNYGPLTIPAKGMTVNVKDIENLVKYIDVIKKYEGKNLELRDGVLQLDGKEVADYTFEQDYYFMIGDNRHNSLDSRFFGFTPENHIIGKPIFLWANLNQAFGFEPKSGWQWDRWFTIPNNGKPNKTSYLWIGGILLALFFGWEFIFKKKKD